MENQNAYAVLKINKDATEKQIKEAYASLVKVYDQETHTDLFMVIEAAYGKLSNPAKRAKEDVLAFNPFQGGFSFADEERAPVSDEDLKNAMVQINPELCANPTPELKSKAAQLLMIRSCKRVNADEFAKAIADWESILRDLDPAFQRAKSNLLYGYLLMGTRMVEHGLYDSALEYWEKAVQMDPDNVGLVHNLAIAAEKSGNLESAKQYWNRVLEHWQSVLDADPDDNYKRNFMVELRRHLTGQADEESAPATIEEYREILKINPDDFEAQYKVAMALYDEQAWKESIDAWATLLKKFPKNIEAINMLGWAQLNSGLIEEAFQTWNRGMIVDPKSHSVCKSIQDARMSVGRAFRNRGMHTQALVHFKALLRYTPDATVYMEIGETYMLKGDKRSAAQAFAMAMQLDPKNRDAKQRLSDMKLRA
jgi:tetratricopeptide (TPR) repeat protein